MADYEQRIKDLEEKLEICHKENQNLQADNKSLNNSISQLEDRSHQFENLFYSSTSILAIFKGPDHVIEIANNAFIDGIGKSNDIIGKPLIEVLPELEKQDIIQLLDQVYKTGESYTTYEKPVELVINGIPEIHYFDFTYQPQKNSKGEITGVADIATNVTKQALLNKKIKKNEREFRKLVNFMPHKISMLDAEGNPTYFNQDWLDYTGKSTEEIKAETNTAIVHPDEKENVEEAISHCISTGKNFDKGIRLRNKNGEYKWHLCKATAIKDDNGHVITWLSSCTEIHELKEEEQRKGDFLKLVSHELKTPVTSIKGYVQLLLSMLPNNNTEEDKKLIVKPYLNRIETQVERLIRLISEMLDLSRIEQQELQLKKETFNLNQQVENILEDITYSNKDVQIELEHDCECNVFADKDRIGQVIINFVTNALKYSPDGNKVMIKVFNEDEDNVAISVRDFGIGIAKEEQRNIFNRFYRVAGNNADTYSGFGIGLYLSNEIIQRHGGRIYVDSEIGEGSDFTFILPLNQK